MDSDEAKRIHRNSATLAYAKRFEPPAEALLPKTVLPAARPVVQGTMAPRYQASRRTGRGAFQLIVMAGLMAVAVVSNLDRVRG